jgi:hypothetical protein
MSGDANPTDTPLHRVLIVCLVEVCPGRYRDYENSDRLGAIMRVSAACTCGWRSSHWPTRGRAYRRYVVGNGGGTHELYTGPRDRKLVVALWERHYALDVEPRLDPALQDVQRLQALATSTNHWNSAAPKELEE